MGPTYPVAISSFVLLTDQTQVKHGVPQGSILGHLHFSSYSLPYCGPMNARSVLHVLHKAGLDVL